MEDPGSWSRAEFYRALRAAGAPREWARRHDRAKDSASRRALLSMARRNTRRRELYAAERAAGVPRDIARGNPDAYFEGDLPEWWRPFWDAIDPRMPRRERADLRALMTRRAAEGPGALSRAELARLQAYWSAYGRDDEDWRHILYG